MSKKINTTGALVVGAVMGAALAIGAYSFLGQPTGISSDKASAGGEKKPLHWVAPMDPNYKRDKPGKSPMGMDLIPVYADEGGGPDAGPGTIKISPEVVNNLGVRTVKVQRKGLHMEIKTVGYVQYDEDQLVHMHPRVEGWIEKLYIKAAGDPVKQGQPLYEIYSPALVNAQEELIIAMDRKNQRLIKAAEERLSALQLPRSAIRELKRSKKVKQLITFFAPQSGVIDNLNIRQGFFVKPGTTLMSIGTLDQVWVEAEVFERQASGVVVGDLVSMSLDYLPGKMWQGAVDYVYPTLDPKTRTVKVRLRFNNENDMLKPNMFTQVVIHAKNTENTLLVPTEAVIRTGNVNRIVLALGEGRFKSIKVKLGRLDGQSAEILEGVKEGERVVTSAQYLLDSESSKTSDFKRMNNQSNDDVTVKDVSAWTEAKVNSLMANHRMVNVTHGAIPEWDWPEMTMDFIVSQSVDFSRLKEGMNLQIEIQKVAGGNVEVVNVRLPDAETPAPMDHSQHQMPAEPSSSHVNN
jgi:Cu(I)/Ag(I) efflux system membrane fusion protein